MLFVRLLLPFICIIIIILYFSALKLQTSFVDLWKQNTSGDQTATFRSSRLIRSNTNAIKVIQDSIDFLYMIYRQNWFDLSVFVL